MANISEEKIKVTISLTQKELKQLKKIAEIQTDNNQAIVKASISVLINNHI